MSQFISPTHFRAAPSIFTAKKSLESFDKPISVQRKASTWLTSGNARVYHKNPALSCSGCFSKLRLLRARWRRSYGLCFVLGSLQWLAQVCVMFCKACSVAGLDLLKQAVNSHVLLLKSSEFHRKRSEIFFTSRHWQRGDISHFFAFISSPVFCLVDLK